MAGVADSHRTGGARRGVEREQRTMIDELDTREIERERRVVGGRAEQALELLL